MFNTRIFARTLIVALVTLNSTGPIQAKSDLATAPVPAQATLETHTQTTMQAAQAAAQNFADFLSPAAAKLTALKGQATQKALEAMTPVLQSALASATTALANNGANSAAHNSGNSRAGQALTQDTQNNGQTVQANTQADAQTNNKSKKNGFKQFFKTHKKRWQNATLQGVKAFIKNTRIAKATNESLRAFLASWKDANPEQQQEFFTELLTALDQEIKDGPVRDAINEIKDVAWYARYRRQLVAASFVGGVVAGFCIRHVIWRKKA